MITVSGPSPRRPSRFLDHLRALTGGPGGGRVGFRPVAEPARRRMGLLAAFRRVDPAAMAAAIQAGADAVEVVAEGSKEIRALADVVGKLGAPVGVALPIAASDALAEAAAEAGVDWLRFGVQTPFSIAGLDRPAMVLSVPADLDLRVASALNGLRIDAVLVENPPRQEPHFGDALRLRSLGEVVKKPLLLAVGAGLSPATAAASRQLGLDALALAVEGTQAGEQIAALLEALERGDPGES